MSGPDGRSTSWDAHRPVRRGHVWVVLGVLALLPGLVAVLLRLVPPSDDGTALVASFIAFGLPFTVLAAILFLIAALRVRRRRALLMVTLVILALVGLQTAWRVPDFVADGRPVSTPTFTVMSINLYNGQAAPDQVWQQAQQADILILIESTPQFMRSFKRFHPADRFPYSLGDVDDQLSDTTVFSRFALTGSNLLRTSFQQWVTDVAVPEVGTVRLFAVHPCNPYCGGGRWATEHAEIGALVAANAGRPLVLAGDFNAVDDHGPMQQLRQLGLRTANDVAGTGWLPTWPANKKIIPPMIPIDHVLISRQLTATAITAFTITGTDHRGLLATLAGSE